LLETLQISALAEDASLFDPSGTSGYAVESGADAGRREAGEKSNSDEALSMSNGTDTTSISNGLSSLILGSSSDSDVTGNGDALPDDLAALDTDGKIAQLCELFPTEKLSDITYTLQKSNGDIMRSMDILLNHVYFSESGGGQNAVSIRGVDAFSEEHVSRRGKKKKGKNRKFTSLDEYASSSSSSLDQSVNKWETANADITFIASRTNLSTAAVSSMYHKNGASRQKTILALAMHNAAEQKSQSSTDAFGIDVISLTQEFPSLTYDTAAALLRLTAPSTAYAHEFAKALASSPGGSKQIHRIVPQYAPIKLSDDTSPLEYLPSPPTSPHLGSSATLLAARDTAFTQASQYHRKGKSDRLMGGAAAYYSTLGRDYHSALQSATAAEADALVSRQSTSMQLDLHGVNVKDATRITNHRVQQWWDNLGEARIKGGGRTAVNDGYRVITGMGRHSEGGVSKLGPAVLRMLVKQGWKVEVGSGVIVVKGLTSGRR
jgi:hypothetical protein